MSRKYDSRTTTFSPEGRLFQVEYAMEAINHAGTCLGIITSDGILLAAERKVTSKLLDQKVNSPAAATASVAFKLSQEKLFQISDDIWCAVAGLTSDANLLIDWARQRAGQWRITYDEPIPLEQLVESISDLKQSYTQKGGICSLYIVGMRPFGASFLFAGWDSQYGFQIYQTDPSGNYSGWRATCIGGNSSTAQSILKTEYDPKDAGEKPTLQEGKQIAFKVLLKTVDSGSLSTEKLEVLLMQRRDKETTVNFIEAAEIDALIKQTSSATSS